MVGKRYFRFASGSAYKLYIYIIPLNSKELRESRLIYTFPVFLCQVLHPHSLDHHFTEVPKNTPKQRPRSKAWVAVFYFRWVIDWEEDTKYPYTPWNIYLHLASTYGKCKVGTLPKTNSLLLKKGQAQKETILFQPSIFRCKLAVSFREGNRSSFALMSSQEICQASKRLKFPLPRWMEHVTIVAFFTNRWKDPQSLNGFFSTKNTVDGRNPAPPSMMIIPLVIGF